MAGRLYERAKNWRETQTDISKLLAKYRIGEVQWTVSDEQCKAAITFIKLFETKTTYDYQRRESIELAPARKAVVRMTVPIGKDGPDRNSAFRMLFWYLKSKLEAIEFHFQDGSEFLSFEREFFGHTLITDDAGIARTAFDAFHDSRVALAPANGVMALSGGKD